MGFLVAILGAMTLGVLFVALVVGLTLVWIALTSGPRE